MARPDATRRLVLKFLAMAIAGGQTLLQPRPLRAAVDAAARSGPDPSSWPRLPRRRLGRTGFAASRLVFGCGAALARRPQDALLDAAFAAGINVFDVGSRDFYGDAEKNLAPFLRRAREDVFLISKARTGVDLQPDATFTVAEAKAAAATWSERLEGSLRELGVTHVDAYYVMAANNPRLVASDELLGAFERARQAGKARHFGVSTHQNAERVLEAARETGAYSLAMIATTPAGWYDLPSKAIASASPPLVGLAPVLDRARAAGIGLVGMKAGRYLAGSRFLGWSRPTAFDAHYGKKLLDSELTPFQRSYAFVLEHGLDVVNADMQSLEHLRENVVAAATSSSYA